MYGEQVCPYKFLQSSLQPIENFLFIALGNRTIVPPLEGSLPEAGGGFMVSVQHQLSGSIIGMKYIW